MSGIKVCNMCGAKLDIWDEQEDFSIIKDKLGYGTSYDSEPLELHLCCTCMEDIINSCQISPILDEVDQVLMEGWDE